MSADQESAVEIIAESDFPMFWANMWEQNLIPPKWAARICGVSESTIYRWAHKGIVCAWRVGHRDFYLALGDCLAYAALLNVKHIAEPWREIMKKRLG